MIFAAPINPENVGSGKFPIEMRLLSWDIYLCTVFIYHIPVHHSTLMPTMHDSE
jgi:hypothetical protein